MRQFFLQVFIFLLASLSSIGLIYISRSFQYYQQLIPILLILDIVIASRIDTKRTTTLNFPKQLVLFISALLVQVIVISSGGFYSPLLILIHIFTLSAIFLLGSSSPIIFLIFSLGVLIFHTSFDRNLYQFFQNDPWAVVIYALSIVIVIPLALFLSHSNSIKDQLSNFLKEYIEMSEKKQKSILTALSNLVIVTDKNLCIISINIAVERLLRTSLSEVEGKPLFDVLVLKDSQGNTIPPEDLPIKQALIDKATHFAEGYFLSTTIQTLGKPITLQIRPLTNTAGEITQVVFVLTDPLVKIGFNTHPSIKEAVKKRDFLLNTILNPTSTPAQIPAQLAIILISHMEEDILTVQEMEDHPIQEIISFNDLVSLIKQIIGNKSLLYQSVGKIPEVGFDDEDRSEQAYLLNVKNLSTGNINFSKYSAPFDSYLVKIVLEKLLDFAVFMAGKENLVRVYLSVAPEKDIKIEIIVPSLNLSQKDLPNIIKKDYPGIKIPDLRLSSGLEGYIAGKIAGTVQIHYNIALNTYKKILTIEVVIPKQAKINLENST